MSKKVKSIQITSIHRKDEETELYRFKSSVLDMDQEGRVITETTLNREGQIEDRKSFEYDAKGRVTGELHTQPLEYAEERTEYNYEGDELVCTTLNYADGAQTIRELKGLNSEGYKEILIKDDEGFEEGKELRKINSNGNLLEEIIYDENKLITSRFEQTFEDQRLVERTEYSEDNDFRVRISYEYDDKGRILTQNAFDESGELLQVNSYTYNDEGQLLEQTIKTSGLTLRHVNQYDEQNRITFYERYVNDQLEAQTLYRYSEEGYLVEEEIMESSSAYARPDYRVLLYDYTFFEEPQ